MFTLGQTVLATAAASAVYVRFAPAEYRYFSNDKLTVALFFASTLTFKLLYELVLYPICLSPIRNLPGPKADSLFNGNQKTIKALPTGAPHEKWIKIPNDGLITYKAIFNTERVSPTTVAAMAEVLVHKAYEFEKPWFMREGVATIIGKNGIFFAEGEQHKFQRKHMNPAFSYRYLKQSLLPIFWSCSTTFIDRLVEEHQILPSSSPEEGFTPFLDIQEWLSRCTLDIIGQAGFGVNFDAMHKDGSELSRAYATIFGKPGPLTTAWRIVSFFIPVYFTYPLIRWMEEFRTVDRCIEVVRGASKKVVQDKKREIEKRGGRDAASAMDGKDKNLISIIMEEMDFPEETLIDQTLTFLAAGHETTATALTWCVYQLTTHPEWQTLIRNEVRTNIPSPTRSDLTPENIESLTFLKAFASEVLRFSAPISLMYRQASNDTTIAGHPIHKGCIVTIPVQAFNRDEAQWGPTAKKFDPYRFLKKAPGSTEESSEYHYDPSGGSHSNFNFMTFFHGPRSCIGKDFAKEELYCVLAALIGRFEFVGDGKEPVIEFSLTNKMRGGLPVKMRWVAGW
ncbi:cytochrome P450 [Ascobolus immersus RN42]|uniref:Cytochrome P450 n=1 Tax=Ascobolus immersus RN42 TaxID=1160509 RepID=A0A3N4IDE8_ASCIM|nr:cytochrome P450 [Ascobolus immersus RN42]